MVSMGPEWLLIAAAAALGLYFYKQNEAGGNLVFFPGTITSMAFEGATPMADFTLQVQNTSNVTLQLYSIAGNVYDNGVLVGNLSNFNALQISPNSQTIIPIKAQFQLIGVVNDIIRSFQTGSFSRELTVNGYANVGGVQVPVNLVFKVG